MRRLFGTIGLTYLTVLAVAFYFFTTWVLLSISAAAALTVGTGVWMRYKKIKYAWTVLISGITALCAVSSLFLYSHYFYQPVIDKYSEKEISFEGYVRDEIQLGNKMMVVPIQTEMINDTPQQLTMNLTLYTDSEVSEFDKVRGRLTLHKEERKNEISHGCWFTASQDATFELERTGEKHFTLYKYAVSTRKYIKTTLDSLLPRKSAALCKAIMLGDRYALTRETQHDITRTGTSFLIVVSGMHLSIICGFVVFILKKLRLKKLPLFIIVALLVVSFTAVTGFPRSVIRAGIMTLITYGGMLFLRKSDSVNSLGAAALILTVPNPFAAGDIGVIMSFTATLGIVLWASAIQKNLNHILRVQKIRWRWLRIIPRFFINLFSVSVSAALWLIPIATLFFQRVSPLVVMISMLVEPIVCVILILILFTVILCCIPLLTMLAKPMGRILNLLCGLFLHIISFFAKMPFSSVNVHHLYFYCWLGFTVLLVIAAYILHSKIRCNGYFVLFSAAALGIGYSMHVLLGSQSTQLLIHQNYGGITIALCGEDTLNLLACGGNGSYNGSLLDTLYSYSGTIQNLIMPNRVNYADYYPMLDTYFDINNIFINEKYRDEIGVADGEDITNNSIFTLEIDENVQLSVMDFENVVYQYLTAGEQSVLFVSHGADIENLPSEYRTADIIIMDFVCDHAELLQCDELIYTGQQNKRWEKNHDSLFEICNQLTPLKNETYLLNLQ